MRSSSRRVVDVSARSGIGAWLPRALPIVLLLVSCAERRADDTQDRGSITVTPLDTPAGAGASVPSLASLPDGRVLLTWHERDGDGHALRLAMLEDTLWSAPATVATGRPFVVNWADFPSALPLGDGRLAVHWLEQEGSDTYAYGVRVAFSEDGGRNWTAPLRPHLDSTETEHGFVSLLRSPAGGLEAVWLDGRNFAADRPEMTLRSAHIAPDGITDEHVLDARICDCCQTDAALTTAGAIVAYRDRSPDEIRDIALVRRVEDGWSEPMLVHRDGWHIDGCPVNGPAIAAAGDLVAVAWYTGAQDTARVRVAFSSDGGRTFGAPTRVDDGDPAGRVDLLLLDDGRALVSWVERGSGTGALRVRAVDAEAGPGEPVTVATVSAERATGFPRMASAGRDHAVITWTDVSTDGLRAARLVLRPAP